MTEALLVFSPESSLLRSLSRKGRARCHWVLQLLALLCALLGLGLVILHKEQLGKAHLATWHGRAGLLAVLWAGLQCSGGVGLLYPKLLPRWPLAKLKLYHATSGLVGYLLGGASLLLGMCSLWFTATVTGGVWKVKSLSPIRLFATPWTAAYQAPPSMGFSRQEYWSGVPLLGNDLYLFCSLSLLQVTTPLN